MKSTHLKKPYVKAEIPRLPLGIDEKSTAFSRAKRIKINRTPEQWAKLVEEARKRK